MAYICSCHMAFNINNLESTLICISVGGCVLFHISLDNIPYKKFHISLDNIPVCRVVTPLFLSETKHMIICDLSIVCVCMDFSGKSM